MDTSKEKYSKASKDRWAKRSPELRSAMMRKVSLARWNSKTRTQRAKDMAKVRAHKTK